MRDLFTDGDGPFAGRMYPADIETHHAVPIYVQEALGIPNIDGSPAMPLHFFDHRAGSDHMPESFHSILRDALPENEVALRRVLGDDPIEAKRVAKERLSIAYEEWIRQNQLAPEGDDTLLNAVTKAINDWITPPPGGG